MSRAPRPAARRRTFEALEPRLPLSVDLAYAGALRGLGLCGLLNTHAIGSSEGLAADGERNVFILASAPNLCLQADIDPGPATQSVSFPTGIDMIVTKVAPSGDTLWSRAFSVTESFLSFQIVADRAGSIYVTGAFSGEGDFDPGPGVVMRTAARNNGPGKGGLAGSLFLLKLNSGGGFEWVQVMDVHDRTGGMAIDQDGNVAVLVNLHGNSIDFDPGPGEAIFSATPGNPSAIVARYAAADGALLGAFEIVSDNGPGGASGANGRELRFGSDGSLYVGLHSDGGRIDLDPGPGRRYVSAPENGFLASLVKLDPDGEYQWDYTITSERTDPEVRPSTTVYGIDVNARGDVFATGFYSGLADFDPGPAELIAPQQPFEQPYVVRLSAEGQLVWLYTRDAASTVGGRATALRLDAGDNVYFSGHAFDDVTGLQADFDSGPNEALADAAMFVASLTADGDLRWAAGWDRLGGETLFTGGLAVTPRGDVWLSGNFQGVIDFDPGPGIHTMSSGPPFGSQQYDVFLIKLTQDDLRLPGDTNGDGVVDINDLNNVRNHFGQAGPDVPGDANRDGRVDLDDLNAVRNNFGARAGGAASPDQLTIEAAPLAVLPRRTHRATSSRAARAVAEAEAERLLWDTALEELINPSARSRLGSRDVGQLYRGNRA